MKSDVMWILSGVIFGMICFFILAGCPKKETVKPVMEPTPLPVVEVAPEPEPEPDEAEQKEARAEAERMLAEIRTFEAEKIYFDFDKYTLKPEARSILDAKAAFLKKRTEITFLIEGHCDERGTDEYNLALGQRRADVAKAYLVDLGISPYRIQTVTYGEEQPLDSGHNEAAWRMNRRDQFTVTSDTL